MSMEWREWFSEKFSARIFTTTKATVRFNALCKYRSPRAQWTSGLKKLNAWFLQLDTCWKTFWVKSRPKQNQRKIWDNAPRSSSIEAEENFRDCSKFSDCINFSSTRPKEKLKRTEKNRKEPKRTERIQRRECIFMEIACDHTNVSLNFELFWPERKSQSLAQTENAKIKLV